MKNLKFTFLIIVFLYGLTYAQNIYDDSKTLTSQAEVTAFGANDYTEITGNLLVFGDDIDNLTSLSTLTSVGGYLYVYKNENLVTLAGLDGIQSVGSYLYIRYNPTLTNVDGVSGITLVGGNLEIVFNTVLNGFCGLFNLLDSGGLTGSFNVNSNASNPTQADIISGGACSSLPVELTTFTASIKENKVSLSWETATEVNNYGFNVERKPENGEWNNIGLIEGHGNSNAPKYYEYVDNSVSSGKYYYRLKQIDIDGSFEYSKTVEVDLGLPTEFELSQNYPNPFNPTTKIQYSIPVGDENIRLVQLKIYDVLGNELVTLVNKKQEAGNYEVNFDASNFTSGIYLYTFSISDFIQTKKMILLR